jgi:Yip1 domain
METTSPQIEASTASPEKAQSFWEDLIDIFISPAGVFRRRQHTSVWPPLLFVSLAIGVIVFATFNTLEPAYTAEFMRGAAKQMAKNPQVTQEAIARAGEIGNKVARFGVAVIFFFIILVLGAVSWLVGRVVGSKQTFQAAMVVAAWSYMPRVLGAVLAGVQGLILDESKLTGQLALSLGPSRFFDPDTTNPMLYQLLGRFDLMTLWTTVLLAVGLYVTGKVSKGQATMFGILIWVVGSLPMLRAGYMAM